VATGADSRGNTCSLVALDHLALDSGTREQQIHDRIGAGAFQPHPREALDVLPLKDSDRLIAAPSQLKDHVFSLGIVRHGDGEVKILGEAGNRADRYG
jgi:hypothetical protein